MAVNVWQDGFRNGSVGDAITAITPTELASAYATLAGRAWVMNAGNPAAPIIAATGYLRSNQNATGSIAIPNADAPCPDYSTKIAFLYKGVLSGNTTNIIGVTARYGTTADTGYLGYLSIDGSTWTNNRNRAGSATVMATGAFPALVVGNWYTLEYRVSGPSTASPAVACCLKLNDEVISTTYDTDAGNWIASAGRPGLLVFGLGTASTGAWVSSFETSYPYAAASGNDLNLGVIGDSIPFGYPNNNGDSLGTLLAKRLSGAGGVIRNVGVVEGAISGATSADFVSGATFYTNYATNATTAGVSWTVCMVGDNDAKTAVATSAATYKSNMASMVADEITAGRKVAFLYPSFVQPISPFDGSSAALIVSYGTKLDEIETANPGNVVVLTRLTYPFSRDRFGLLEDGVHPANSLLRSYADFAAPKFAQSLGYLPGSATYSRGRVVNASH